MSRIISEQRLSKKRYILKFFSKTFSRIFSFCSLCRNNRSYTTTLDGSDTVSMVSTRRELLRYPCFSDMPLHDIYLTLLLKILMWQSNTEWHTRRFRTVPRFSPLTNGYIASLRQERVVGKTLCRLMSSQGDILLTFVGRLFRKLNKQKPQYDVHIAGLYSLERMGRLFSQCGSCSRIVRQFTLFTSSMLANSKNLSSNSSVNNLCTV